MLIVEVTKAVVEEFLADGRLRVVSSEDAELVLKGMVIKFELTRCPIRPIPMFKRTGSASVMNVSIEDVKAEEDSGRRKGSSPVFISDYAVTHRRHYGATKIAKEVAIKKASQDIAWTLRSRSAGRILRTAQSARA